jgi:hypothetical protein
MVSTPSPQAPPKVENGTMSMQISWNGDYLACKNAYAVTLSFSSNATDVAMDIWESTSSPFLFVGYDYSGDFKPGKHYYKITKTFKANMCGTGSGSPAKVTKTGTFTVQSHSFTRLGSVYI